MKQTLLTNACLPNEIIRTKMWLIKLKTKKMKIMKNVITVALAALVISTAASAQKPIFGLTVERRYHLSEKKVKAKSTQQNPVSASQRVSLPTYHLTKA